MKSFTYSIVFNLNTYVGVRNIGIAPQKLLTSNPDPAKKNYLT